MLGVEGVRASLARFGVLRLSPGFFQRVAGSKHELNPKP